MIHVLIIHFKWLLETQARSGVWFYMCLNVKRLCLFLPGWIWCLNTLVLNPGQIAYSISTVGLIIVPSLSWRSLFPCPWRRFKTKSNWKSCTWNGISKTCGWESYWPRVNVKLLKPTLPLPYGVCKNQPSFKYVSIFNFFGGNDRFYQCKDEKEIC